MKYLLSTLIIYITHSGIILGISILNWIDILSDKVYVVLLTTLYVTFFTCLGVSAEKYLTPIFKKGK